MKEDFDKQQLIRIARSPIEDKSFYDYYIKEFIKFSIDFAFCNNINAEMDGIYKNCKWSIKRNSQLTLNGYIEIKKDVGFDYEELLDIMNENMHGGSTFQSGRSDSLIFGFDCAHYSDWCPTTSRFFETKLLPINYPTYKTYEYVLKNIKKVINIIQ
jgi:hypothetical protein